MPIWLLLLLGGGVIVIAGGKSHKIDEAAITAVTKHALVAEGDVTILRKLQDLLSHSGRFELAALVKARAQAFDYLPGGVMSGSASIKAPKMLAVQGPPPPPPANVQAARQAIADLTANYQRIMQTPYALSHPAFQQNYTANYQKALADLQAKLKALGG